MRAPPTVVHCGTSTDAVEPALASKVWAALARSGHTIVIEPTEKGKDRGLPEAFGLDEMVMVGANGVGPRVTRSSGIWISRLYRGRVLVTMGGVRPPLRSVRSA